MDVDLVPFEVVGIGKTLLTKITNVFGRRGRLRDGDRNCLNLLHDLSVLHHMPNDDLLRLLLLRLLRQLLYLSHDLLWRLLVLNDRLLRLLLLLKMTKQKCGKINCLLERYHMTDIVTFTVLLL